MIKFLGETSLRFVHFFILIDDGREGLQICLSFIFVVVVFFVSRACYYSPNLLWQTLNMLEFFTMFA